MSMFLFIPNLLSSCWAMILLDVLQYLQLWPDFFSYFLLICELFWLIFRHMQIIWPKLEREGWNSRVECNGAVESGKWKCVLGHPLSMEPWKPAENPQVLAILCSKDKNETYSKRKNKLIIIFKSFSHLLRVLTFSCSDNTLKSR